MERTERGTWNQHLPTANTATPEEKPEEAETREGEGKLERIRRGKQDKERRQRRRPFLAVDQSHRTPSSSSSTDSCESQVLGHTPAPNTIPRDVSAVLASLVLLTRTHSLSYTGSLCVSLSKHLFPVPATPTLTHTLPVQANFIHTHYDDDDDDDDDDDVRICMLNTLLQRETRLTDRETRTENTSADTQQKIHENT